MNADGLQVDLVNGQITVTRPATNDTITYRKSEDAPHLELAHSWIALGVTTPEISEFRTQAFQAAVDKARELAGLFDRSVFNPITDMLRIGWHVGFVPIADIEH